MKKKFFGIVLLLAVFCAGQGIFAQEEEKEKPDFKVIAVLRTGVYAMFTDRVDDGPYLGMGSTEKSEPLYLLVKGYYANAAGTAGIDSGFIFKGLRVDINSVTRDYSTAYEAKVDNTFGWLKMFNNMLTLYGGLGEWEYAFYTPAALDTNMKMEGLGTVLVFEPFVANDTHDLKIGLSAWAAGGLNTLLNEAKYIVSAEYEMKDTLKTVANFGYRQYGPKFYADEEAGIARYREQFAKDHRVNFGVNFLGLSNVGLNKIAADIEVRDLGGGRNAVRYELAEFDREDLKDMKVYPLYLGQSIGWENFGLNLNASARQLFRLGDEHVEYAPVLTLSFTAAYAVNDFIIPKLGFEYYKNTRPWGYYPTDLRFSEGASWEDCIKNTGGLGAYLGSEFRFFSNAKNCLELGYALKMDTSEDAEADGRKSTLDHGLYLSVLISY